MKKNYRTVDGLEEFEVFCAEGFVSVLAEGLHEGLVAPLRLEHGRVKIQNELPFELVHLQRPGYVPKKKVIF